MKSCHHGQLEREKKRIFEKKLLLRSTLLVTLIVIAINKHEVNDWWYTGTVLTNKLQTVSV